MDLRPVPLELRRIDELRYELLALPFFEDERPLRGAAGLCDWRLCGRLSRLLVSGRVTGAEGEATLLPAAQRLPFDKLLLLGLGPREGFHRERFERACRRLLEAVAGLRLRALVTALPGRTDDVVSAADAVRWFLELDVAAALDEVVLLDEPAAHRVLGPTLEAVRQRARASRALEEDEGGGGKGAG